jgi:N-acetylmuramoyl-L-alanine amidase
MAVYQPIFLTGDYVDTHDRQRQALDQQCVCVLEFHFNASTSTGMRGGEVYHKPSHEDSRYFAEAMWAELAAIGLPPVTGGRPVKSTAAASRTRWIDHYAMIAILLEPLFISNQAQAQWLHLNVGRLAEAVVTAIQGTFPFGGRIGLSAGHENRPAAAGGSWSSRQTRFVPAHCTGAGAAVHNFFSRRRG